MKYIDIFYLIVTLFFIFYEKSVLKFYKINRVLLFWYKRCILNFEKKMTNWKWFIPTQVWIYFMSWKILFAFSHLCYILELHNENWKGFVIVLETTQTPRSFTTRIFHGFSQSDCCLWFFVAEERVMRSYNVRGLCNAGGLTAVYAFYG